METVIKSRKLRQTLKFERDGIYIICRCEYGKTFHIAKGGRTYCPGKEKEILAPDSQEEFERICKSWYNQYIRG
jgi:hypothetical protein